MVTLMDSLQSLCAYPIPEQAIEAIAVERGLDTMLDADSEAMHSNAYKLAKADVLMWLVYAPNVSQGGVSYTLSDEQRKRFLDQASSLYKHADTEVKPRFGYKGSRL